MYIFKNALRSISRSKGRNILLGIIVFAIAVSSCVALSIRQAADQAKEEVLAGMEITASISVDRTAMMQGIREGAQQAGGMPDRSSFNRAFTETSMLTLDELLKYAVLPSVKEFNYSLTISVDGSESFLPVDLNSEDTEQTTEIPGGFGGGNRIGMMGTQGDFTLIGYSSDSAMTDFLNGVCYISEGAMFKEGQNDMTCIISDEIAVYNSLEVGDTINIVNPNNEEETYALTVTGIYHNTRSTVSNASVMGGFSAATDPANYIYTSYATVKAITDASGASAVTTTDETTGRTTSTALASQTTGTYVFSTVENFEAFEEEARTAGLSESYMISSVDVSAFEQSMLPLNNLSKFSLIFLLVVLLIGGIILAVLNIFNIRERKYEIGVLTAIGMKKPKVAVQFVAEIFAVTIAAIIIGTASGAVMSVPVANRLLESQVEAQSQTTVSQEQAFGRQINTGGNNPATNNVFTGNTVDYISEVSSATNWSVVLQLFAIGILLTLAASLAAVTFIMRYEPLKILSNRD